MGAVFPFLLNTNKKFANEQGKGGSGVLREFFNVFYCFSIIWQQLGK
jgi:hypothetical protein